MDMGFAERLKALREDNDEKQKDIAELLKVSISMISFYESGVHFPRDEKTLLTIANHFDVSMDYLMGMTDIPNYKYVSDIFNDIRCLSEKSAKELADYIEYLKFKEKNQEHR